MKKIQRTFKRMLSLTSCTCKTTETEPKERKVFQGARNILLAGCLGTLAFSVSAAAADAIPEVRNEKEANMSFHIISDTHVKGETGTEAYNFAKGLQDMKEINPSASAFLTAGDNTQNGTSGEVNAFFKILEENHPLTDGKTMIALGNHDVRGKSGWVDYPSEEHPFWSTAYNLYMTNNDKYMPETEGKTYFDYWVEGYHFIVLNPENSAKDTAYLSDEQVAWLDEKLSEKEDMSRPAFVIIHQALRDTHWRSLAYNGFGPHDEAVKEVLAKHPQTIWMSGHIHNGLGVTEAVERPYGTMVDLPAFTGSAYGMTDKGTGYEVYVYDDEVLFRARNFVTSTWLSEYDISVKLKTLPVQVAELSLLSEENYTQESWAVGSERLEQLQTEAMELMSRKYADSWELPQTWLYHREGRKEIEELQKELTETVALMEEKDVISAVQVRMDRSRLEMTEGETSLLTAQILPENTTDQTLNWTSSDSNVISVDAQGNVTANRAGSAVITAATANGKTAQCQVTAETAPVQLNTELPVCYFGQPFDLPGRISITLMGETFETNVIWKEEDLEAVRNAKEAGIYTVTGTLSQEENRVVQAEVFASPANVVYFADSGATEFSKIGQMVAKINQGTIKNSVPDQAYDEAAGWGFTNSPDVLEASKTGDAYATVRNFKGGHNGETMSYRFAMEAGSYDVTAGFQDPWAQYAGDSRHAKVFVTDDKGTELAAKADHHISGRRTTVSFTDVMLNEEGTLDLNVQPLNSGSDNCDVLISFIMITKNTDSAEYTVTFDTGNGEEALSRKVIAGGKAVRPAEPERENYIFSGWFKDEACSQSWDFDTDTVNTDIILYAGWKEIPHSTPRECLESALMAAEGLSPEAYTKESYAVLKAAIIRVKQTLEAEDTAPEEYENLADLLASAVKGLVRVQGQQNAALEQIRQEAEKKFAQAEAALKKTLEEIEAAKKELENMQGGLSVGDQVIVKGVKYRVTDAEKKTAEAYGVKSKKSKNVTILSTVRVEGVKCRVTAVADKAFAGLKRLEKAVVGKNVVTIGKKAFYGDKNLRTLTLQTKKLKGVGKQALKGISAKAVIKAPKAQKKTYIGLFKGKGQKKSVTLR